MQKEKNKTEACCPNCFSNDPDERNLISVPESERKPQGPLWEECKHSFHNQPGRQSGQ
jgi:hypothetical protein